MNPTAVYTVVFSPTGTSRKIAAAVAQGVARHGGSCNATANTAAGADAGTNAATGSAAKAFTTIDLTHAAGKPPVLPADAAAVFAVPVYGGRVAPAALERLQEIRGEGTPAVVLAVYGNRAFGTAVAQLAAFVAERGFVPVAAGAFVGEHSYSTPGTPIAEGRPDTQDLAEAAAFGARIGQKLAHGETGPIDAAKLREPHTPLLSKEWRRLSGVKNRGGFDAIVSRLQMRGYVITIDFEYAKDRSGTPYGWGLARYATPEQYWGSAFSNRVYKDMPEDSGARIADHLKRLWPEASGTALERIIGSRP